MCLGPFGVDYQLTQQMQGASVPVPRAQNLVLYADPGKGGQSHQLHQEGPGGGTHRSHPVSWAGQVPAGDTAQADQG